MCCIAVVHPAWEFGKALLSHQTLVMPLAVEWYCQTSPHTSPSDCVVSPIHWYVIYMYEHVNYT